MVRTMLAVIAGVVTVWALDRLPLAAAPPYELFFSRLGPVQTQLFIATADGSGERALLPRTGLDYSPSLSADGKWVVFTSERSGSADIYRVQIDGSGLARLTTDPAYDDQATLSPDGKTLAFVSTRGGGKPRIWLQDVLTGRSQLLTRGTGGDFRPAWSPDGDRIAFTSDRNTHALNAPGQWERLHSTALYLIRRDGTQLQALTRGIGVIGSPRWSADGRRIVYYETSTIGSWYARTGDGSRGETHIVSIDVKTGRRAHLTRGEGVRVSPQFLPKDSAGYLMKYAAGEANLRIQQEDGTFKDGPRGQIRNPSWSNDGERVVYHKVLKTQNDEFQLEPAFSKDTDFRFTRVNGGNFSTFSPDGTRIALGVRHTGANDVSLEIMNPDGSNRRTLLYQQGAAAFSPAWSPDGKRIAFSLGRYFRASGHPSSEVAVINADGSGLRSIANDGSANGFPSWSPDGKRIVYKQDEHLVILTLADSTMTRLTLPGTYRDNFPQWSPKGGWIVFTSDRERDEDFRLYLIRPDGSGLRKLTDAPGDAHAVWSPDGEWVIYSSAQMGFKDERVLLDGIPQPYGELFMIRPNGTGLRQLTDNQWEDANPAWRPATASRLATQP